MVVSEMGEEWSPKMAPPSTAPTIRRKSSPSVAAIGTPMGSMMAKVGSSCREGHYGRHYEEERGQKDWAQRAFGQTRQVLARLELACRGAECERHHDENEHGDEPANAAHNNVDRFLHGEDPLPNGHPSGQNNRERHRPEDGRRAVSVRQVEAEEHRREQHERRDDHVARTGCRSVAQHLARFARACLGARHRTPIAAGNRDVENESDRYESIEVEDHRAYEESDRVGDVLACKDAHDDRAVRVERKENAHGCGGRVTEIGELFTRQAEPIEERTRATAPLIRHVRFDSRKSPRPITEGSKRAPFAVRT